MTLEELSQKLTEAFQRGIKEKLVEGYTPSQEGELSPSALIYCPLRRKLERIQPPPFGYKMQAYIGSMVHQFLEAVLEEYRPVGEVISETEYRRELQLDDGNRVTIRGKVDLLIPTGENAFLLIDFKTRNESVNLRSVNSVEDYEVAFNMLRKKLLSNPSAHYLWQMLLYRWILAGNDMNVKDFGFVYITKSGIITTLFKAVSDDPIEIVNSLGEKISPFAEHPEVAREVNSLDDLVKWLVQRHERLEPIHGWECRYCWYGKTGLCPHLYPGSPNAINVEEA